MADVAVVENIENVDSLEDVQRAFESAETLGDIQLVFRENSMVISEGLWNKFGISSEKFRNKFGKGSEKGNFVTTTLQIEMLSLWLLDNFLSARELAAILTVSSRGIEKNIRTLKENNSITRVGGRKEGYWSIQSQRIDEDKIKASK